MPVGDQPPDPSCSCEPVADIPGPPSQTTVKKEQKIREVHVSAGLMEEFLRSVAELPFTNKFSSEQQVFATCHYLYATADTAIYACIRCWHDV